MSSNILIFGATGVIGRYITQALIENKGPSGKLAIFTSRDTTHNKSNEIDALEEKGVEIIIGDVNSEQDVLSAYKEYDTVVSALGRNAIHLQIDLIRLAEQSPTIKRFYPSEFGTDIEYGPKSPNEPPHQQKLKVRKYIRENVKRLEYTYLVTGPYAEMYVGGNGARIKAGGFDVRNGKAVLPGTGDERVSFTTMPDVGTLLVASLKHPEASHNRALKVSSFTTTPHEMLAEFEKQTGKKWDVSYLPLDELEKLEKEAWEKKDPFATVFTLKRIWTEGGTLYEKRDNDVIGDPKMQTLEEVVAGTIQANS